MFRKYLYAEKDLSQRLEISCSNRDMDTWIYANRRKWLAYWIEEAGGRPKFEKKYEYTRSQVTQFLSEEYQDGKSIGELAARRIEKRLGKPDRAMEAPFEEARISEKNGKSVSVQDLLNAQEIGELIVLYAQASPQLREFVLGALRDGVPVVAADGRKRGSDKP